MSANGLADVQTALMNVRFEGHIGHDADGTRCLLLTQSGHSLNSCSKPTNPLAREMSEAEALSHFLWGEVYGWDGVGLMDVYGFI
jgi:hypothetical protein